MEEYFLVLVIPVTEKIIRIFVKTYNLFRKVDFYLEKKKKRSY